jgi:hypothetical protein
VRCGAKNKSGQPCGGFAIHGSKRCCMHTGNNAQRFGTKGGHRRAIFNHDELKPIAELQNAADVLRALAQVFSEVHAGKVDTKVGNCLAYLGSAYLSALQVADHEERLKALEGQREALQNARTGGRA